MTKDQAAANAPAITVNIHQVKLKTRKEMERTIPRERWGWWHDVCPGQHMTLRDATAADLARCSLKSGSSMQPQDYLCELPEDGSLIHRDALQHCRTFAVPVVWQAVKQIYDVAIAQKGGAS